MRSVYRSAEHSNDRILQQKAGAMVREAAALPQTRSAQPLLAAASDFTYYCKNTVLVGPNVIIFGPTSPLAVVGPPWPPAKPITPQEA